MAVKHFKCACQHCAGKIEYPAEAVGLSTTCPHCRKETELTLPPPVDETAGSAQRRMVWLGIAALILLIGVVAVALALFMLNRLAQRAGYPNR